MPPTPMDGPPPAPLEIDEEGLVALVLSGRRRRLAELTPAEAEAFADGWARATADAAALVAARLGREPGGPLAARLAESGALYLLSRRADNAVSKEMRDVRAEHFRFLLETAGTPRAHGGAGHGATAAHARALGAALPRSL